YPARYTSTHNCPVRLNYVHLTQLIIISFLLPERDAEAWRKKIERESNPFQPTPVLELAASNYPNIPVTPENRGITLHDHPDGPIETFDAFVCFTIDDRAFVLEMMKYLEKSPFNMKLCVGFRDVVPGAAWMTTSAEIIGKRYIH
ncbi:myeloid differentiation primary response protein MyD88-like, partial [Anneissia japonica]|uniref:myeloid differentiation primary response protein MyD88-like n=1 Tax=Anneissia japonica TaxID=1529436 RepID=UPI001425A129